MMGYYNGYGVGWGTGLGWISMILFWVAVIWFIVWLVKQNTPTEKPTGKEKTPQNILKERYARGEIMKKEYEEIKKDLSK